MELDRRIKRLKKKENCLKEEKDSLIHISRKEDGQPADS